MRNITRGEVVETNQRVFTVADLSNVWVIASVPEKDVEHIQKDQTVEMVAAAYPHALFHGTITYIGDVLDPATRTLRVRITAPNPEKRLKPEMFALVRLYAAPNPQMLTVPLSAIQNGPAGKIVFVQLTRPNSKPEPSILALSMGMSSPSSTARGRRVVVTKGSFTLKSEMERHKIEPAS